MFPAMVSAGLPSPSHSLRSLPRVTALNPSFLCHVMPCLFSHWPVPLPLAFFPTPFAAPLALLWALLTRFAGGLWGLGREGEREGVMGRARTRRRVPGGLHNRARDLETYWKRERRKRRRTGLGIPTRVRTGTGIEMPVHMETALAHDSERNLGVSRPTILSRPHIPSISGSPHQL